jgi:hypothetical protein
MPTFSVAASAGNLNRRTRIIRSAVMSYVAALTVNAAIVLSAPQSTPVHHAPIILRMQRRLIADRWHEGELVQGDDGHASVVVVPLYPGRERVRDDSWISSN